MIHNGFYRNSVAFTAENDSYQLKYIGCIIKHIYLGHALGLVKAVDSSVLNRHSPEGDDSGPNILPFGALSLSADLPTGLREADSPEYAEDRRIFPYQGTRSRKSGSNA
jgi:hypothetical protein